MGKRVRDAVAPVYLFLCLLLGGSGQGVWANMVLQLIGLGLICWSAIAKPRGAVGRDQLQLFCIALLALGVCTLDLVPLPPGVWQQLGARTNIAEGYRILGESPPWLPISLTPYRSLASLLSAIPALAILAATLRLGCRPWMLAAALLAGTFGGILLGALQVTSANPETSPWYLYPETNVGLATGFFANANHMADLLVVTLPFLAAIFARAGERRNEGQSYSAVVLLVAGATLVIAVGIALNGSLAGYGLALPVLIGSALIAFPGTRRQVRWLAPIAAILLIGAVGWLSTTPLSSSSNLRASTETSVQSRQAILQTSLKATAAFMPFGSGLGSFRSVYALYEDHDRLDPTTFVNHAHNDYVEVALELGLPGVLVVFLFLLWWARTAWAKWQPRNRDPYEAAATIASAAILLHSVVDFPLRTAALSACFAMCLGILVRSRPVPKPDKSQLWPTRHIVIE